VGRTEEEEAEKVEGVEAGEEADSVREAEGEGNRRHNRMKTRNSGAEGRRSVRLKSGEPRRSAKQQNPKEKGKGLDFSLSFFLERKGG
jgi:hypothetical protein